MAKPFTIKDFMAEFPTDEACLDHLFKVRYGAEPVCPKCGQIDKFHRLAKLPAYTCNCGHHVHPMAGTPFARSHTALQKWFYVMFMFTTTRNGVSAKEIQRQIGCTYKTAWRMGHEIRKYMTWVDPVQSPEESSFDVRRFVGGFPEAIARISRSKASRLASDGCCSANCARCLRSRACFRVMALLRRNWHLLIHRQIVRTARFAFIR